MVASSDRRRESMQVLVDTGLLIPLERGRPRIYQSEEERMIALRQQKKICNQKYAERLRHAKQQLKELVSSDVDVKNILYS